MKQEDEGRASLGYIARDFVREEERQGGGSGQWRGGREKEREWKNEKGPRKKGDKGRAGEGRAQGRGHPSSLEKLARGKCVLELTIATHQN